jgi:hypothetical protein
MLAFLQPYSRGVKSIMDVVIRTMSKMLYDASPMGKPECDAGVENFAHQLRMQAFPLLLLSMILVILQPTINTNLTLYLRGKILKLESLVLELNYSA